MIKQCEKRVEHFLHSSWHWLIPLCLYFFPSIFTRKKLSNGFLEVFSVNSQVQVNFLKFWPVEVVISSFDLNSGAYRAFKIIPKCTVFESIFWKFQPKNLTKMSNQLQFAGHKIPNNKQFTPLKFE